MIEVNNAIPILVVMPVFNAGKYLFPAIDSIFNQTFDRFFLLIVDDGSTDGSAEVIKKFSDPRLITLSQTNQGPGSVMEIGLRFALKEKIPYIARMDADDISEPDRLKTQLLLLNRNPNTAACSCNSYYINQKGSIIGSSTIPISNNLIRWEIRHGLRGIIQGSMMIRAEALQEAGGYRSKFHYAEEIDLFLRLIENYKLSNVSEYLYKIRLHDNSFSLSNYKTNFLYAQYALDCYKKRNSGKVEQTFKEFLQSFSTIQRINLNRELNMLKYWRMSMETKKIIPRIIAGFLDPLRVVARVLRIIETKYY